MKKIIIGLVFVIVFSLLIRAQDNNSLKDSNSITVDTALFFVRTLQILKLTARASERLNKSKTVIEIDEHDGSYIFTVIYSDGTKAITTAPAP